MSRRRTACLLPRMSLSQSNSMSGFPLHKMCIATKTFFLPPFLSFKVILASSTSARLAKRLMAYTGLLA